MKNSEILLFEILTLTRRSETCIGYPKLKKPDPISGLGLKIICFRVRVGFRVLKIFFGSGSGWKFYSLQVSAAA